jgi:hypothetical protein
MRTWWIAMIGVVAVVVGSVTLLALVAGAVLLGGPVLDLPSATPRGLAGGSAVRFALPGEGAIPVAMVRLYRRGAHVCPGLSWTVLAAIGTVESDNGRDEGTSSAGAEGPMQMLPATFRAYAVRRGGRLPSIDDPAAEIVAAARDLCANGAAHAATLPQAIFAYNHADWYVRRVLRFAGVLRREEVEGGGAPLRKRPLWPEVPHP